MPKRIFAIALAAMGAITGMQSALASDNLFKSCAYDSPLANYTEAAGFYDCSADVGATARCLDDVGFIDHKFTASLVFSGDKLVIVSLFTPYDRDVFARSIGALSKTFGLLALTDGKSVLDLVDLAGKVKNKDEYAAKLSNYESVALAANDLTYTFFEGITSASGASSAHSVVASAPDNIRGADLIVSGEGDESMIIIKFSFPKLDEHKMAQQAKKPVEAF